MRPFFFLLGFLVTWLAKHLTSYCGEENTDDCHSGSNDGLPIAMTDNWRDQSSAMLHARSRAQTPITFVEYHELSLHENLT